MLRVVQVPSCVGSDAPYQYLSTFLINEHVAIDAGALGLWGGPEQQAMVGHVFLTHAHLDHIASLPMFLENVYTETSEPVVVYGQEEVLAVLQTDIFNDRVYPDFIRISREYKPVLTLQPLTLFAPAAVCGLRITPVPVNHVVPTVAYLIADDESTIAVVTDSAPSEAVWAELRRASNLKAVFLEVAFPQSLEWLADLSKHLTTDTFVQEVKHLPPGVRVYAIHLKAKHHAQILAELAAAALPQVSVCVPGRVYEF
jgi:ribonuclease BN (tRNA processing enzyme)